jgi:AraC-like DNA-binding protein
MAQVPVEAGGQCDWHDHPCTELVYTDQTAGVLWDGAKRLQFKPGQVFSYQPGSRHRVELSRGGEHDCFGVKGCDAHTIPLGVWDASTNLIALVEQCKTVTRKADALHQQHLDLLAGLIVLEVRSALDIDTDDHSNDYALQARQIIENRFDEPLSLGQIASHLYISPDYLRQLFRKKFGQSPIHFLIRKRIEVAQQLLQDKHLSIQEVALRCGFDNPYYFSRMFRKLTGQTASQYRKQNANQ